MPAHANTNLRHCYCILVLLSELILTHLISPVQLPAARLGPMRFTDESAPGYSASPIGTLQVFSVKVAGIKRNLQWCVRCHCRAWLHWQQSQCYLQPYKGQMPNPHRGGYYY